MVYFSEEERRLRLLPTFVCSSAAEGLLEERPGVSHLLPKVSTSTSRVFEVMAGKARPTTLRKLLPGPQMTTTRNLSRSQDSSFDTAVGPKAQESQGAPRLQSDAQRDG